tara:strand:- start:5 stop:490 length:486 start_codon:yes stop_codon:yes gene_type:complete
MKNSTKTFLIFALVFFTTMLIAISVNAQIIPQTGDSIYYSPKYCDTSESIEDALDSWAFSGNIQDCFNPSQAMLDALWPGVMIFDSYDCCCKVASTPGLPGAFTGFEGGDCESYLDGIGFVSIEEHTIVESGLYVDIFGRSHTTVPDGISVKNGIKYYKLN